ncbi:hypothetical protein D3C85_801780 [compost metagenome]
MAVPKNSDPVPQDSLDDRQDHLLLRLAHAVAAAIYGVRRHRTGRNRAILLRPVLIAHRHGADADIEPDGHPDRHGGVAKPAATPGAVVRGPEPCESSNKKPSRAGWFFCVRTSRTALILNWDTHLFDITTFEHATCRVNVIYPILSGFLEAKCVMEDRAS